jgi:regulator of protease activity HflC (stomatin/prohibitin superfamily)
MRAQALDGDRDDRETGLLTGRGAVQRGRFGPLRGGDGEDGRGAITFGSGFCVVFIFLMATCVSTLGPNEYGLLKNTISGGISLSVSRGGIHLTGPFKSFLVFPATQQTLVFAPLIGDRGPIVTRAGGGANDPSGSGQDVTISCAFQFKLFADKLREAYMNFGSYEGTRDRIMLLVANKIAVTAQSFPSTDYWQTRQQISDQMLKDINATLVENVGAQAVRFELMRIDFNVQFEQQITATQVAEETKDINLHEQQVQRVVQEIAVMTAENEARIANIAAEGRAMSKEIMANATKNAFNQKQDMKAQMYGTLQATLGLNDTHMGNYFKIKSIQAQMAEDGGSVVVGMPSVAPGGR